jgi:hypothetical protein
MKNKSVIALASKEERKGTLYLGPLGPQHFESPYVSMSSLCISSQCCS